MIDVWSSAGVRLPRLLTPKSNVPLPIDEIVFRRMTREMTRDQIPEPETRSSLLAEMVRLNRILLQINDFNMRASTEELDLDTILGHVQDLSDQLDVWLRELPDHIRDTRANMERYAAQGLGRVFAAIYLGYYHYGQMLFYRFLHEDSQSSSTRTRHHAGKCKDHAQGLCNIVYASEEVPGCDVSLLFEADEQQVALARSRLEKNYVFLIRLRSLWPTLEFCMDRLMAFHEAYLTGGSSALTGCLRGKPQLTEDIMVVEAITAEERAPLRDEPVSGPAEDLAVEEHARAELRDYRSPPLSGEGGGGAFVKAVSVDKAARNVNQPMGRVYFLWELPSLLVRIKPDADAHAMKEYVLGAITLVAKSDFIELKTCRQYLEKYHPSRGLKVVEAILEALASPGMDPEIKDILMWLCLSFRTPKHDRTVVISTGLFDGIRFRMSEAPMPSSACWSKLFKRASVVLMPGAAFHPHALLNLSFGALLELTAVEYPVSLESGVILMGYSTALVPVDVSPTGQVIWHLEVASGEQQLRKSELEATKGPWLQRQSLEELYTSVALLGWCTSAQVRLGTGSLAANVTWSNARAKTTTWRWKGANLQLLAQSAAPLQAGAQVGFSWERVVNTVRFTPGGNYTRCLANSTLEHAVLYDVATQRAWLVPLISVYHHMLLTYQRMMAPLGVVPNSIVSPTAGSSSSFQVLRDSGGVAIEGSGQDSLTVRELILGFSINFSMTSAQAPKGSRIYGYELLDLVVSSPRSELKATTVKGDGLGWAPLLKEIPCLFCAGLGDVIVGTRASEPDSPCNYLPTGRNLLASPVEAIRMLCQKQGSTFTRESGKITREHVMVLQGQPFTQCDHSAGDASCWDHPEDFVQNIHRGTDVKNGGHPCKESDLPDQGAVILGGAGGHSFVPTYEFWR
ncbi:hypothetical protein HFD88_007916 [Aspergillus terreus]|nr:hypothetical protein HFD88_007916 [Aspergillus terreus]